MTTADQIREQQRATWNKFSSGWNKWDSFVFNWLEPIGEKILELARLEDDALVLDVATGTGEPGLSAAARIGGGKVIGTDIAEEMVKIANANAKRKGILNYEAQVADTSHVPFADASFDAVTCRFGVMYFPNPSSDVQELARVLKPGGRIALSAWAEPAKNPWATTPSHIIQETLGSTPPPSTDSASSPQAGSGQAPPDAPGVFRHARPSVLAELLGNAGLHDIETAEVQGQVTFESPEHYWEFVTDVMAPVAVALSQVDRETYERVKAAVMAAAASREAGSKISFEWSSWVTAGRG